MGFSPRVYGLHLFLQNAEGDWSWDLRETYDNLYEATKWFNRYRDGGHSVRLIETKTVKAYEDGKLYS